MAIIKTISTNKGVEATYHKITQLNIDLVTKKAVAVISSFKDKSTRNNYPDGELMATQVALPKETIEIVDGEEIKTPFYDVTPSTKNNIQTAYATIKTLPEWSDALDD